MKNQNLTLQTNHKLTYTGLLSNFKSFTSFSYEISLIRCLIDRSFKICNNFQQTFVGFEDVFKPSLRHVLKTSSKRLERKNFSSPKTSCKYFLKTSWKTKNCYAEDILKTCLENFLKTPWRQTKCLLGISLSNI